VRNGRGWPRRGELGQPDLSQALAWDVLPGRGWRSPTEKSSAGSGRANETVSGLAGLTRGGRSAGKPMTPDDLRRLHDYLVDIEVIEVISDEMRIVIESEWPEFIHKLPPRR
jgi:hypothetical protein